MEDRSALFNQLKNFSQRKLKKVETKVVTASGEQLVEKRGAKGLQVLSGADAAGQTKEAEPARKLDLQVGLVLPGFLIGSQDVAHDKSSLENYGVTHILNLDADVENKFEDDYNYKNVAIQDKPDFELDRVLDDCFEFIDDGRHYGNVLIHCSGTIGLSRSTTICIAYLMSKEKQSFAEAFNNVKEVRSFVKPNEGFIKQLKDYEVKLRGAQQVKDSGIDDPFALRKKQEIEQEKAMVAGAASVKNRMKMFGATLDTQSASNRSKSVSPAPPKPTTPSSATLANAAPASRWSTTNTSNSSKSMTPEPRKSWQSTTPTPSNTSDWRSSAANKTTSGAAPPPPPPIPGSLHAHDKSVKTLSSSSKSALPPPPPPPPPPGDLLRGSGVKSSEPKPSSGAKNQNTSTSSYRKPSISESSDDDAGGRQKMVFGRRPPPPMKIRGGLSIERQDSLGDKNMDFKKTSSQSLFGPTSDQQQQQARLAHSSPDKRCASPLVLMNNVTPSQSPKISIYGDQSQESHTNPFKYWQQTVKTTTSQQPQQARPTADRDQAALGQLPKRTVSLGPRRQMFENPPVQCKPSAAPTPPPPLSDRAKRNNEIRRSFNEATRELQSSLTELNKIISDQSAPSTPQLARSGVARPPRYSTARQPNVPLINTEPQGADSPPGDENEPPKRWQWQEDLDNWKLSSSVNDLKSMFEQTPKLTGLAPSCDRPPRSASPNVLRKSFWEQKISTNDEQHRLAGTTSGPVYADYTIRRTTSTSSSQRPILRNPHQQGQNWKSTTKSSLQLPLKKQFTSDSDGESGAASTKNSRSPSPSAALRAAKQQVAQRQQSKQSDSDDNQRQLNRKPSIGQLNRSSTKKLLNLIKTKTRTDLTLPDGDENDEIDALLGALENESIDNIDWDELGLDENEVKDIIRSGAGDDNDDESSSSSSSSSESDNEEEEEVEVETSTQHYVIRTKY